MIGILEGILGAFEQIPKIGLWIVESFINLFFETIGAAFLAAIALLPSLPEPVTLPSYVSDINWFFPVGTVLGIATPMLAAYVTFLGVRWVFTKLGVLG